MDFPFYFDRKPHFLVHFVLNYAVFSFSWIFVCRHGVTQINLVKRANPKLKKRQKRQNES